MPEQNVDTSIMISYIIGLIIIFFFCWSLFTTMKQIPEDKRTIPAWTCWLILIPFIGFIFQWILEPFAIPRSLQAAVGDKPFAKEKIKKLATIGLSHVVLVTLMLIPSLEELLGTQFTMGLEVIFALFAIAALILWIIYWFKVVKIRREYLEQ